MATSTKESKFLEEIDDNFLSCTICSERYKNAKILPCLHSFCEPCLGKLAEKSGVLTCPICRRSHELPDTGVSGIGVNLFINELVEVFRKREESSGARQCQGCRQADSVKHCVECGFDLCKFCSGSHGVLPTSRSHRLMTLEEYQVAKSDDPAMLQPPVYCDSHVCNQIKFYCDTCDVSICLECTVLDHPRPEHKYRYLKDATEDYSKDLKEEIDKVKVKENEASISKTVVMETIRSLDKCYQTEEKKMKGHIQKMIDDVTRMIRENGDKLLRELKDEYESRKLNLNAQLKELECVESGMSHAREYAEKLMHYGNAAQLMSAKKGIASQMEELLNVETKTDPYETDYIEFQPCDDFYTTKSVGVLLVSTTPADHCQLVDVQDFVRKDEDIIFTIATDIQRTKTEDTNVEINAVMKRPDNTLEDITAINNNDGTWSLKSKAKMTGKHEIRVSVFKKPVKGSPVTINVIPQKGLICKFGRNGSGVGELNDAWGVRVTKDGKIRVCERGNRRLQTFTLDGQHSYATTLSNGSTTVSPMFSAISEDGSVFTTDSNSRKIIVHDENGRVIRCFGGNVINYPFGIAISPVNGRVYVVDYSGHCIHIYSQDGHHYKSFGCVGQGNGQLSRPIDIAIDAEGNVFVSDQCNSRIQVFDAEGQYLHSFGSLGSGDNQMSYPWGISLDRDGNVYVCDSHNNRVMKYRSRGKFICRIDCEDNRAEKPSAL